MAKLLDEAMLPSMQSARVIAQVAVPLCVAATTVVLLHRNRVGHEPFA